MKRKTLLLLGLLILQAVISTAYAQPRLHDVRPGYDVREIRWLSDYLPALKGTAGDTPIYVLRGAQPGGTMLVIGGTHADEIAGVMAATWMVERMHVQAGTVFVIPHANNSASTHHAANRNPVFTLQTPQGVRSFAYGDRLTNPVDQSPDPSVFEHPEGWTGAGEEARNLDRAHPGKADGTLTQQVSFAIVELIKRENVDVAFDLHEAGPTSRLANMIVANPKSVDYAAEAVLNVELETGITMKLEISSPDFHGLSHKEWGDHTQAQAFLIETPNPGQDRERNQVDVVNDPQMPLAQRVGVHLQTVQAVVGVWNAANAGRQITWDPVPTLEEMLAKPLGSFYN